MRWPEAAFEALAQLSQWSESAETGPALAARLLELLRGLVPQASWSLVGQTERGEPHEAAGERGAWSSSLPPTGDSGSPSKGAVHPEPPAAESIVIPVPGPETPRLHLVGRLPEGVAALSVEERAFVETAVRLFGLALRRREDRAAEGARATPAPLPGREAGAATATGRRWLEGREPILALFRSQSVGFVIWHEDGRIEAANAAFLQMLGLSETEIVAGRVSWESLTPPEFGHLDTRALAQLRERGEAEPYEKEFFHRDGHRVSVLCNGASLDREQRVGVAILMDVSESRRLEAALWQAARASETLGASLDHPTTLKTVARLAVPEMSDWCLIFLLEEDGAVRLHEVAHSDGGKVQRIWDIASRHALDINAPAGPAVAIRTGRPQMISSFSPADVPAVPGSPSDRAWLEALQLRSVMAVPLFARGKVTGAITFGMSESDRHFGLRDLELAMDLAHRAGLALDNARLYRQLEEAVRARDRFMAAATHELRTPTTTLRLLHQILRRDLPAEGDIGRHLQALDRQIHRLAVLVERLLDVAELGEGRLVLKLEEIGLAEIVERVLERDREPLERAGCALQLQIDPSVRGRWDRERLELVVSSLLSNAAKFGAGRPVVLSAEAQDGRARLRVSDQGIGIAPEHHGRIFQRFERAVSERNYGGLGLGLWLVRQIVEAHGGTVHLESAPEAGATFTVELPLRQEPERSATQAATATR